MVLPEIGCLNTTPEWATRIRGLDLRKLLRDVSEFSGFIPTQDAISLILILPRLRIIQFDGTEVGTTRQLLQFLEAFPYADTLCIRSLSQRELPDPIAFQRLMEKCQQQIVHIHQFLVCSGGRLSLQLPELVSALDAQPFKLRLRRLGWTMILRTGCFDDWDVISPQVERIFRGSEQKLEDLHLGMEVDDSESNVILMQRLNIMIMVGTLQSIRLL